MCIIDNTGLTQIDTEYLYNKNCHYTSPADSCLCLIIISLRALTVPKMASSSLLFMSTLFLIVSSEYCRMAILPCVKYTASSTWCQVHSVKYTMCQIHSVKYTVSSTQCQVHSVKYTVSSTQCQIHSVKYTMSSTQCQVFIVCSEYCRMAILHSVKYPVSSTYCQVFIVCSEYCMMAILPCVK